MLPPVLRSGAQRLNARLRARAAVANVWRWEARELGPHGRPYRVVYLGLEQHRRTTLQLLNLDREAARTIRPGPVVTPWS